MKTANKKTLEHLSKINKGEERITHTQGELSYHRYQPTNELIIQLGEKVIATMDGSGKNEANARRIVKCVNMHDELIEFVKKCKGLNILRQLPTWEKQMNYLLEQAEQK